MLETPQVAESAEQRTARIPLVIPRADIGTAIGPGLREVHAALATQGIAPTGPWFTHHRRRPTDTFDFAICVPVATKVAATGRVEPGLLPASRVARAIYHGPYEGLADAWGELFARVAARGLTPRADLWERYLVGPESGPDPSAYRTELNAPLAE